MTTQRKWQEFRPTSVRVALLAFTMFSPFTVLPTRAQAPPDNDISLTEFRQTLLDWGAVLDGQPIPGAGRFQQQFQALSDASLIRLYRGFPNPRSFQKGIGMMKASLGSDATLRLQSSLNTLGVRAAGQSRFAAGGLSGQLFTPQYPDGNAWNAFIATLKLGALTDTNGVNGVRDERCDTGFEAGLAIAYSTAKVASEIAATACDGDEEPVSRAICFTAAVVTRSAELATEILQNQCGFQDGSVDSAELQAAYENSKIIWGGLNELSGNVATGVSTIDNHVSTVEGKVTTIDSNVRTIDTKVNTLQVSINNTQAAITTLQASQASNQALNFRLTIETELLQAGSGGIGLLELPASAGGYFEEVRKIVVDTMQKFRAAGQSVGAADSELSKSDDSVSNRNYKAAFTSLRNAYRLTVQ